ncbi:MAG TPA: hypothetical protein VFJ94_11020 [Intrasporangium sp.]|uniref:hypothetical protein n=1 Tax=Intrasporangium sp. TaxID=1925024 RepID=UPI002D794EC4|nr:hypothetical protein [Intrasporangium sp.]HET7399037.1 hypothetical protein [Intrasporangium sp.]
MPTLRPRRTLTAFVAAALAAVVALLVPPAATAAAPPPLIGAHSLDYAWLDAAVGPMQIYRDFDTGFSYPTWQDTKAYKAHPNAPANHYSVTILPQRLLDPADPINAQLQTFIASTPKNIILTNYHEPDFKSPGKFTPEQFRAGILRFADMVRAQNLADGGTRRTSVILMDVTFQGAWTWPASDWWPTDARDGGHVDLIAGDIYALPHNTNTACCPVGYTDGIKWLKAPYLLSFLIKFAQTNQTPWAVAELGYLEDIYDPGHKAQTIRDVVAVATANGADHVSYFDAPGKRGNWRLRYSTPVGTTSMTSQAALAWKALAGNG